MSQSIRPPVRLISVPAHHPYVDAVAPAGVRPVWADRVSGWDPDPIFDPGAVRELAGEADLVHLHFGFDQLDRPRAYAAGWPSWPRAELPLVFTVHDLRNPHHLDPGRARRPAGRTGAGGRRADHPDPGRGGRDRPAVRPARHGAAAPQSGGPDRGTATCTDRAGAGRCCTSSRCDAICRTRSGWSGPRPPGPARRAVGCGSICIPRWPTIRGWRRCSTRRRQAVEFAVHPRFDDGELERYLRRAQVTVLPHRWGTHSGWLELARDLGTRVVAPDCGFYAEQWSEVVSYINNETHRAGRREPGRRRRPGGGSCRRSTRPAAPTARPSGPGPARARAAVCPGDPAGAARRGRAAMSRPGRRAGPAPGGRTRSARRGPARDEIAEACGDRLVRAETPAAVRPRAGAAGGADRPPAVHRPAVRRALRGQRRRVRSGRRARRWPPGSRCRSPCTTCRRGTSDSENGGAGRPTGG